jgi:hypothetical protein
MTPPFSSKILTDSLARFGSVNSIFAHPLVSTEEASLARTAMEANVSDFAGVSDDFSKRISPHVSILMNAKAPGSRR